MSPALCLSNIGLTLSGNAGKIDILHNIDLTIETGETVGLVGPSGSGKSSLLMIMGGLEQASTGTIRVLDQDITHLDEDALARFRLDNMGVVFQSFHLLPTMTALENVSVPLELAGIANATRKAREALDTVGLADRMNHYPNQMSGGEQQRVALARATASKPKILLADEPTGNLDQANGSAIVDLMFGLRDHHDATLVIVTHADDLADKCDTKIKLLDGRLESSQLAQAV